MRRLLIVFALYLTVVSTSGLSAQTYEPRYDLPDDGTSEVVLLLISTSGCIGNKAEKFDEAVREAKISIRDRVEEDGDAFFAIGAAAQWSVEEGLAYLMEGVSSDWGQKDFGQWDEVWAGRNWLNSAAIDFIWKLEDGSPSVPQLIVFKRPITTGSVGIQVGETQILAQVIGGDGIVEWYEAGMPLGSN